MGRRTISLLALAATVSCATTHRAAAQAPTLVVSNVTLIDGAGGPPERGVTVVVEGRHIRSIGRVRPQAFGGSTHVIDGSGRFLVPGLWDMHVHLAPEAGRARVLEALVAHGVTSVRDMGTNMELIVPLRARIARATMPGPRIMASGFMVESPRSLKFWDAPRARNAAEQLPDPFANARRLLVTGPDDAESVVDSVAAARADFVKVIEFASAETFVAVARAARRRRLPLATHTGIPAGINARAAAEAGIASFEHDDAYRRLFGALTDMDRAETFAAMRDRGTIVVPTLIVTTRERSAMAAQLVDSAGLVEPRNRMIDPIRLREWRNWWETTYGAAPDRFGSPERRAANRETRSGILRAMHAAGVRILPGTDLGSPLIYPGSSLHDELELLVTDAGLTPSEAIEAATRLPAEFFHMSDSLGTLKPAMIADMVLLEADPTVDIRNIRRVAAVVIDGRVATAGGRSLPLPGRAR